MVSHGESEQLRTPHVAEAPVHPDVFHDRPPQPTVTDRAEARVERGPDTNLDYARAKATETANLFLLRGDKQITRAEFQVLGGVLDLGVKTGAWTPENFQQIRECLESRAGHQQNSLAAQGLRNMSQKLEKYA